VWLQYAIGCTPEVILESRFARVHAESLGTTIRNKRRCPSSPPGTCRRVTCQPRILQQQRSDRSNYRVPGHLPRNLNANTLGRVSAGREAVSNFRIPPLSRDDDRFKSLCPCKPGALRW